jgi:WD40 repeat protein
VTCTEWRLRVNYKLGKGRQDIGIPYAAGCAGYRQGVSVNDDDCTSNIEILDAASQVRLSDTQGRDVPLQVTRDGHRVAYLSKKSMQFVGWDLPTAQRKTISPRLDAQALDDVRSLEISPDGKFFAVSFAGDHPRLLLTDFTTGQTTTLQGFCAILGMSQDAARIAAQRTCPDLSTVTILKRDGAVISEWRAPDIGASLSPDSRFTVDTQDDYIVTRDATTGKLIKKRKLHLLSEPSDAVGHAWLTNDEYIVEAKTPEPDGSFGYYRVNVKSGISHRIRDLDLNPGSTVSLGTALIREQP